MQEYLRMKDLPDSEKPYEKCLKKGAAALSDAELIAAVIRTGSHREQAIELARKVLKAGPDGILNLMHLSLDQLQELHGIGSVKAVQLKCVAEISRRIAVTSRETKITLNSASSIADYYMEQLRHEQKEHLILSMFDSKGMLLCDALISIGTCNASLVSPREVFLKAIQTEAVYVILLHNHPSGVPEPSKEDILVTKRIKESGELLNIPLMDHIIIGDNRYFSFREQEMMQ